MDSEPLIRLGAFLGVFLVIALWETKRPRRQLLLNKFSRWVNNLGLVAVNTVLLRLVFPAAAVGLAAMADEQDWGLLNQMDLPFAAALLIGILALDLVIYFQHVLFHSLPLFWRLHMVHHADMDYDVTTGLRFHPFEILLSMLIKMAAILVLGPPAIAVITFEILLNASSMFNHGNLRLPDRVDALLRLLIVTPDMHRVHHSVVKRETNSNYGFNLSVWDRIFGTYRAQPELGHEGMTIGLNQFRDPQLQKLKRVLLLPFGNKVGEYPINRDEQHDD